LNASARRGRKLEELNKRVAFWENWIRTVSSTKELDQWVEKDIEKRISRIMHEARVELAEAGHDAHFLYNEEEYRALREFKLTFKEFQSFRKGLPAYRRLLLLYKAPNPSAKRAHLMFHFPFLAFFSIGAIEVPVLLHLKELGLESLSRAHHPVLSGPVVRTCVLLFFAAYIVFYLVGYHRRARMSEDDENYYVWDRRQARARGIVPATPASASPSYSDAEGNE
jgi:hypothetical protein